MKNGQYRETSNTVYKRRRKTKLKHNTICVGHHYTQTNTSKDEPKIVFYAEIVTDITTRSSERKYT